MHAQYFGLTREPFSSTIEKDFLYCSPLVQETYEQILHAIRDRQECILLTGGVGSGKTTLLHRVMDTMGENVHVIFPHCVALPFENPLIFLCEELGIESVEKSRRHLFEKISCRLTELFQAGKPTALFIDEAQSLSEETLADLKALLTLQTENRLLLPILFAGQDLLADTLGRDPLLTGAIAARYHLEAFDTEEVGKYITFCLQSSGFQGTELFTTDAVRLIADMSGGVPRKINAICDLALQTAFRQSREMVTRDIISEIGGFSTGIDLDPDPLLLPKNTPEHPWQGSGSPSAEVPAPEKSKTHWAQKLLWVGGWAILCIFAAIFGKEFFQSQPAGDSLQANSRFSTPENFNFPHNSLSNHKTSNLISPAKDPGVTKEEQDPDSSQIPGHLKARRSDTPGALQKKNISSTVSRPALAPPKSPETHSSLKRNAALSQSWMQPDMPVESALVGLTPDSRALFEAAREENEERVKKETPGALQKKKVAATVSRPALSPPRKAKAPPSLKRKASVPQPWVQSAMPPQSALEGLAPGSRALFEAALEGNEKKVENLLRADLRANVRDARGETPLMYAVRAGETSTAKKLLKAGTFVNLQNRDGTTALIQGAFLGYTQEVRALLRNGAHLDIPDNNGRTALMASAWNGHAESSKLLLVYGSDPNLKSREGWTPLMYAAFNNHVPVVEMLLWKGADVKLRTPQGEDIFELAKTRKNVETLNFLNKFFSSTATR